MAGGVSCCLTLELSRTQRRGGQGGLATMYRVPPARPGCPAAGCRLERLVRLHFGLLAKLSRMVSSPTTRVAKAQPLVQAPARRLQLLEQAEGAKVELP